MPTRRISDVVSRRLGVGRSSVGAEGDVVGVAELVVVELVARGGVVEAGLELVDVLGVVVRLLELLDGRLLHVVGEHAARQLGPGPLEAGARCDHAVLVGLRRGRVDLVAVPRRDRVCERMMMPVS